MRRVLTACSILALTVIGSAEVRIVVPSYRAWLSPDGVSAFVQGPALNSLIKADRVTGVENWRRSGYLEAISPDGTMLAATSGLNLLLIDATTGATRRSIPMQGGASPIACSTDSRYLFFGHGLYRIGNATTLGSNLTLPAFSENPGFAAAARTTRGLAILRLDKGSVRDVPNTSQVNRVLAYSFARDEVVVLGSNGNNDIRILKASTGTFKRALNSSTLVNRTSVAWFAGSQIHVVHYPTTGSPAQWHRYDAGTGNRVTMAMFDTDAVPSPSADGTSVDFSRVGERPNFANISILERRLSANASQVFEYGGPDGELEGIAHHPTQNVAVYGTAAGSVTAVDSQTGARLWRWRTPDSASATTLVFSADGSRIVVGSGAPMTPGRWGRMIRILDASTGNLVSEFDPGIYEYGLQLSRDGQIIAVFGRTSQNSYVRVFDLATGTLLRQLVGRYQGDFVGASSAMLLRQDLNLFDWSETGALTQRSVGIPGVGGSSLAVHPSGRLANFKYAQEGGTFYLGCIDLETNAVTATNIASDTYGFRYALGGNYVITDFQGGIGLFNPRLTGSFSTISGGVLLATQAQGRHYAFHNQLLLSLRKF